MVVCCAKVALLFSFPLSSSTRLFIGTSIQAGSTELNQAGGECVGINLKADCTALKLITMLVSWSIHQLCPCPMVSLFSFLSSPANADGRVASCDKFTTPAVAATAATVIIAVADGKLVQQELYLFLSNFPLLPLELWARFFLSYQLEKLDSNAEHIKTQLPMCFRLSKQTSIKGVNLECAMPWFVCMHVCMLVSADTAKLVPYTQSHI